MHDLLGELHLPSLASDETIWIGDRIGDGPTVGDNNGPGDYCECSPSSSCFYPESELTEASPRDPGYADKGAIYIAAEDGLAGQVIVNGDYGQATGTGWKGPVILGDGTPFTLSMDSTQPYEAPYYEAPSSAMIAGGPGDYGGSVGVGAFAFYETDCYPPHNEITPEVDGLLWSEFASEYPVRMRWRGPVRLPEGITNPIELLTIEVRDPRNDQDPECDWIDLTSIFTADLNPDGEARTIGIGAIVLPRQGVYRVTYNADARVENVFFECEDVTENPQVFFPDYECEDPIEGGAYVFQILPDCNANDTIDFTELNETTDTDFDGELDECEDVGCPCDWNDSGTVTVQDLFDFLAGWFGGCIGVYPSPPPSTPPCNGHSADINNSGTISPQDIFDFLACWFDSMVNPCE